MEHLKFKTTIKCSGCVDAVTPYLDELAGKENWTVDLKDPARILTVKKEEKISEREVVEALQKAGYKAERLDS